jgi:putative membrane protein
VWNATGSYGWGVGPGWGRFGVTHTLLWRTVLLPGIAVLARWLFASGSRDSHEVAPRALDILAERYARGELDRDKYEKRKRDKSS